MIRGSTVVKIIPEDPKVVIQAGSRTFVKSGEVYTPSGIVLKAVAENVNDPSYSWGKVVNGVFEVNPSWGGNTTVTVTPSDAGVIMVRVSGSNTPDPISDHVEISVVTDGETGESLTGKMLYRDPTFKTGLNNVVRYGSGSGDAVRVERVARPSDAPTGSGYALKVSHVGGGSPGHGGVYQAIQSRANAVFVQRVIAKLPVGYRLNKASNAMGDGAMFTWLTGQEGTGRYETYLLKIRCGASGVFSTGGYLYVTGSPTPTADDPLEWYIAYMTAFDQSEDGYGDIELAGKDSMAEKLGYGSWAEMVEAVSAKGSIIQGDYIRATLIDTEALAADTAFIEDLTTKTAFIEGIKGIEFDFQKGKAGGFSMDATMLWSGQKFGNGAGIALQSMTNNYGVNVYKDDKNHVEMFYRESEWGLKGLSGGAAVFQLGSTNKIGPFVFNASSMKATYGESSLALEADRILFQNGYEMVSMGVVGGVYGRYCNLAVQSGDIYHQGVIQADGNRECRFYASAIYARGYLDIGTRFGIKPTYLSISQRDIYLDVASSFIAITSAETGGYVFNPPGGNWTGDSTFLFVVNWSGKYIEILRNDGGALSSELGADRGVVLVWNGSTWLPIMQGSTYH